MADDGRDIVNSTVLVVDDIGMMRRVIREALEGAGVSIVGEAPNGREAVRLYNRLRPQIVIMDITMPVMNGIEALRRIKALNPNAAVIMCSSMNQQKYIMKSIQLGARDFIVKPFKTERIISAVKKATRSNGY
jgi:two-component system, chemotaxis family, chemotaxis protein CheY